MQVYADRAISVKAKISHKVNSFVAFSSLCLNLNSELRLVGGRYVGKVVCNQSNNVIRLSLDLIEEKIINTRHQYRTTVTDSVNDNFNASLHIVV